MSRTLSTACTPYSPPLSSFGDALMAEPLSPSPDVRDGSRALSSIGTPPKAPSLSVWSGTRLALLEPIHGFIPVDHYVSMTALHQRLWQEGIEWRAFLAAGALVHRVRNRLWREVNESGFPFTAVAWIDSDIVVADEDFIQLLAVAREYDVVSARYLRKRERDVCAFSRIGHSSLYTPIPIDARGLLEVAAVGLGCCIVARRVFDALQDHFGYRIFEAPTQWNGDVLGEDIVRSE